MAAGEMTESVVRDMAHNRFVYREPSEIEKGHSSLRCRGPVGYLEPKLATVTYSVSKNAVGVLIIYRNIIRCRKVHIFVLNTLETS